MERVKWAFYGALAVAVVIFIVVAAGKIEYTDEVWVPVLVPQIKGVWIQQKDGGQELAFEDFKEKCELGEITPILMMVDFKKTTKVNSPSGATLQYFGKSDGQLFTTVKNYNFLTNRIPEGINLECEAIQLGIPTK